jgi:hypothetical protein
LHRDVVPESLQISLGPRDLLLPSVLQLIPQFWVEWDSNHNQRLKGRQNLSYFLDTVQWLDASAPPLEKHLGTLSERVKSERVKKLLVEGEGNAGLDAKRPAMQTAPRGETPDTRRGMAALSAGVAALLILAAAGGWYVLGGRLIKPAQAAHLSVVVLRRTAGDARQRGGLFGPF